MSELKITDTFKEVKQLFNICTKHTITALGRIAVHKFLILPKLLYLWIMLPDPPVKFINETQKLVRDKKRNKRGQLQFTVHQVAVLIFWTLNYIKALKLT